MYMDKQVLYDRLFSEAFLGLAFVLVMLES